MRLSFVPIVACAINCGFSILAAAEKPGAAGEDSSAGLPDQYAKNYLTAASTISPDKKFAVIYPTLEAEETAEDANHRADQRLRRRLAAVYPAGRVTSEISVLP